MPAHAAHQRGCLPHHCHFQQLSSFACASLLLRPSLPLPCQLHPPGCRCLLTVSCAWRAWRPSWLLLLLALLLLLLVVLLLEQAPGQPSHPATAHEDQPLQEIRSATDLERNLSLIGSEGPHKTEHRGFAAPVVAAAHQPVPSPALASLGQHLLQRLLQERKHGCVLVD
jgi:hypothetical protein